MTIDQHIEELRAELRSCLDAGEIDVIERELEAALSDRFRLESSTETDAATVI